jgi:hypothetical protein
MQDENPPEGQMSFEDMFMDDLTDRQAYILRAAPLIAKGLDRTPAGAAEFAVKTAGMIFDLATSDKEAE